MAISPLIEISRDATYDAGDQQLNERERTFSNDLRGFRRSGDPSVEVSCLVSVGEYTRLPPAFLLSFDGSENLKRQSGRDMNSGCCVATEH
jgi:hypothetical protein